MNKLTYTSLEGESFDTNIRVSPSKNSYLKMRVNPTYPSRNKYLVVTDLLYSYFEFTQKGLRDAIKAFNLEQK